MTPSSILTWEDRLTRFALALLWLATAYGIVVGATISMYYDWNFVVSGSMINEFHPSPYVS